MLTRKLLFTSALTLALTILSAVPPTAAQQSPPPDQTASSSSTTETIEALKELEKQAVALLDEVATEARTLKLVENRIRLQMMIVDLLWPRDEERARALFKQLTADLVEMMGATDMSDPNVQNSAQMVMQFRHEMLNVLSERDTKLALEFLRATRQPQINYNGPDYRAPDQELMLEMTLAAQVAARDPGEAVRLIEEGLSKGVTSGMLNVLSQLQRQDPAAAAKVTGEIIKRLRPEEFGIDHEMTNVAINLWQMNRPPTRVPTSAPTSDGAPTQTADASSRPGAASSAALEQTRRELAEKLAAAVTGMPAHRTGNVQHLFASLKGMMPELEKYAPARAPAVRRRMSEFEKTLPPSSRMWQDHQALMQNGSVDAVLEAAAKAPSEMREQFYSQAAWKAAQQNDVERARQIIGNISNPQLRAQMLRDLERQMPRRAAERGDFEQARQLLSRLTTVEERVNLLLQLASVATNKNNKEAARQFTEEAYGLVAGRAENQQQFSAQLQVAQTFAATDAARSFELVEGAIGRLNELLSAAAVIDGFGQEAFRQGELKHQGGDHWSELARSCGEILGALAPRDFARARSGAERFERTEVRTLARLMVAQGVLSAQQPNNNIIRGNAPTMSRRQGYPKVIINH